MIWNTVHAICEENYEGFTYQISTNTSPHMCTYTSQIYICTGAYFSTTHFKCSASVKNFSPSLERTMCYHVLYREQGQSTQYTYLIREYRVQIQTMMSWLYKECKSLPSPVPCPPPTHKHPQYISNFYPRIVPCLYWLKSWVERCGHENKILIPP